MSHVQQGKHTFCNLQSFISCEQICSIPQHNSLQDQPLDIDVKLFMCSHFWIFSMGMFETTKEYTLTKDLVCSMIMISENAAQKTTMEWSSVQL